MSKEELNVLNEKLVNHLTEKNIKNAFYYQPVNPDWYWNDHNKIKIGICNIETYNLDGKEDYKGINLLTTKRFEEISYGNKTIANSVFLNFCIKKTLRKELKPETAQSIKEFRRLTIPKITDIKSPESQFDNMYEAMYESIYFNFRYSVSGKRQANFPYVIGEYTRDAFFQQHYRDYVNASEIDILILGSTYAIDLINKIYPELKGKLSYCGEPVMYNGVLFVSIPHPSRISYEEMADCVNKITNAINR